MFANRWLDSPVPGACPLLHLPGLLPLEKTRKHMTEMKLADISIKLAAHRAEEDAARVHLDSLIASTSECQELFNAVEGDYKHATLCTALAEEARAEFSKKRQREDNDEDEETDEEAGATTKEGHASNKQASGKAPASKARVRAGKAK